MAVFNIPEIMEDELLFSFIDRMAKENAMHVDEFAYYYVNNNPKPPNKGRYTPLKINSTTYIPKIAKSLNTDPIELFYKTTVYPGTAPFISAGKQSRIINNAFHKSIYRFPILSGNMVHDVEGIKYCPQCHNEDTEKHGFTWLRRAHHMPGVTACWKHGVTLLKINRDAITNKKTFTPGTPEKASECETALAVFAKELLSQRYSAHRKLVVDLAAETINRKHASDSKLQSIRKLLIDNGNKCSETNLLRLMFDLFHDAYSIPEVKDEDIQSQFAANMSNYSLLSDYTIPLVKMCKNDENEPFVTTPWGFNAGWRSPSEDNISEQEKFTFIVHNTRNGEYEPAETLTSMGKRMKFLHKECGQTIEMNPWDLIENGTNCPCQKHSLNNIQHIIKLVEKSGKYHLLSVSDNLTLTIRCLTCWREFDVTIDSWYHIPECRFCMADKKAAAAQENFEKKVRDLTGDEYTVIGNYISQYERIDIRHNKCGKTASYIPQNFLQGVRCECDTYDNFPKGKEFRAYVSARSCGTYKLGDRLNGGNYLVENTLTGQIRSMSRQFIIQELERTTPSTILPLEEKGEYIPNPKATRTSEVSDYLSNHYIPGELFDTNDIDIPGMDRVYIERTVKYLGRLGVVEKAANRHRIYRYIGNEGNNISDNMPAENFDRGYEFRQQVKDLTGDEYEVVGEYASSRVPIDILHKKCWNIISVSPKHFLYGRRCKCDKKAPDGDAFLDYVKARSCGLYEAIRIPNSSDILIRNTKTGEEKKYPKAKIVQEFERPTPSPVFPMKEKGEYKPDN